MADSVAVLGGGISGLWTARKLVQRYPGLSVTLLERSRVTGGLAGGFLFNGVPCDLGSHRLHPSAPEDLRDEVDGLLDGGLLLRPRHGRMLVGGRWVPFPLSLTSALGGLPPSMSLGVLRDALLQPLTPGGGDDFRTILERGLGRTISRSFYLPYARKLWGLDPSDIEPEQARRRVSSRGLAELVLKTLRSGGRRCFHYPERGFLSIARNLEDDFEARGGKVLTRAEVIGLRREPKGWTVEHSGEAGSLHVSSVFSTLPLPVLARMLHLAGVEGMEPAISLSYRAMCLIYLYMERGPWTEWDAHYVPEQRIPFSRISEPLNYSGRGLDGRPTVVCLELPCDQGGRVWDSADTELVELAKQHLELAGLRQPDVADCRVVRESFAYPVYRMGSVAVRGEALGRIDRLEGMVSLGRQGLFMHDNVHHDMDMAESAADCWSPDGWNAAGWADSRRRFENMVVED